MQVGDKVTVKTTSETGKVKSIGQYGLIYVDFDNKDRSPFARKVFDPKELIIEGGIEECQK